MLSKRLLRIVCYYKGLKIIKKNVSELCEEQVQEVGRVDSSLLGEAGLQPVLLHSHGLRALTQQILELLHTHKQQQLLLCNNNNNNDNNKTCLKQGATPTVTWTACSTSATMCVTSELTASSSSPSYVLQLRSCNRRSFPDT